MICENREVFAFAEEINFIYPRLLGKFAFQTNYPMKVSGFYFAFFCFIICQLMLVSCFGQSVASPDVKCVSVAPNGDVTLTWALPAPGSFVSYHIDTSSFAAGPFTNYTTISPYTSTSCTHGGAGANNKRMFYKVYTESSGSVFSAPKDTFSTIFLNVANPGNGKALLSWNKISNHPISTSSGWYKIYREYPALTWTLIDSTTSLKDTDLVDICSAVLNYRIEIKDNTGCTSVSNSAGGSLFTDQTTPALAPIDTVSVNAAGNATISWYPSPSRDADSIRIYRSTAAGGPWNPFVTVPVPQISYTNTASVANTVSEYYRIAFLDSCGNISPQGVYHRTIFLSSTFDICAATASLKWNKYINMNPSVFQYQIYRSVNAGAFTLLANNGPTDTIFVDAGLQLGNSYCYFIRATDGVKTSTSNKVCFSANVTQPPTYHYNRYATVISNSRIDIKAYVDPAATSVKYYNILRAINGSGTFSTIATLPPASGTVLSHTDATVNAMINSYVYKINAMDSCGHVITSSNPDTTILLKVNVAPNLDIDLSWNAYGSWLGKVDHYNIYRAVDGVWNPAPIGTATVTSYTDDVSVFTSTNGIFSYKVVAVEGTGNTFGFADSSVSNTAKLYEYPKIYIPNAFTPNNDGINDIFIPLIGFVDSSSYSLRIFDNTGTPIIISANPAEGWDGNKRGHPCPEGVYMYLINCKASNGDDSQLTGTVSLIR